MTLPTTDGGYLLWGNDLYDADPNHIEWIPLSAIVPSPMNVRLFIERESLESLERKYREYLDSPSAILPDAVVLRYRGATAPFELLAGHRRVQAANNAGMFKIPSRIVNLDDEAAYRLIREANNYEILTTVERAYAVAEMDRLGFTREQIRESLGNIGIDRYLRVGRLVHPDWFTDATKLCDPSITVWGYAAKHGPAHFRYCFEEWNRGAWDEEDCSREFRRTGTAKPPEPYQAGAILSVDKSGKVLRFRGTLDLAQMSADEMLRAVVNPFLQHLHESLIVAAQLRTFGERRNYQFSPDDEPLDTELGD